MKRRQFFGVAATGATVGLAGCASVQAESCLKPAAGLVFEYYQIKNEDGVKGDWRWRLRQSRNGKTIASGQGYTNRADALHAISLMKASFNALENEVEYE